MKTRMAFALALVLSLLAAAPAFADTPEEILRTAVQLYQNADYDLAADQFAKFMAQYPKDAHAPDAQYGLAESDFAKGSVKDALAAYDALIARFPGSAKAPDARLRRGDCQYLLKDYLKAAEAYKAFLAAYPDKGSRADALGLTANP